VDCLNTSWTHFRDNKHTPLAESRAQEVNSDVELVNNEEPMQKVPSATIRRLETLVESATEVPSPSYTSPTKDNPFLDSESEDDIFKDYEGSKDNGEKVEEGLIEVDVDVQDENLEPADEEPEEEVEELEELEEPEDDFVEPDEVEEPEDVVVGPDAGQNEGKREIVPCIAGACDKDKQSVTVSVNGEAVKVSNVFLNFELLFFNFASFLLVLIHHARPKAHSLLLNHEQELS
jgi:hypothetical protein